MALGLLKPNHHLHLIFVKKIIGRTMLYIKDRTMDLMIIFHVKRKSAH